MRSRFSAYALGKHQYIIDTYAADKRQELSVEQLKLDQQDTLWKMLKIRMSTADTVEFSAYYTYQSNWYVMHEKSYFLRQNGKWVYDQGDIFEDSGQFTPKRNETCPCGSGKKFKKCCMA
ncbi:YchJ family protein [Aliiglaciecola litoralis]|uniref:YchJ family protein n=2 Tax=Aliiglaciecola litoralis TaxID=582857 RepID=A0ABN1LBP2_9ALTE